MKFFISGSLVMATLAITGCSGSGNGIPEENQQLANQVMELHDSAMVHSSRILKLKSRANLEADSLGSGTRSDSLRQLSASLYKADQLMLDWMHQYREPNLQSDTAATYLKKQLELIQLVKNQTDSSLWFAKLMGYENK
ncbi:MAG: hypothetical protein LCH37_04265 [Bacteroidetes bacterium]|nr:hypothetical protein [Bacteroidota bacterium]